MSALRKAGVWLGLVEEDDGRADEGAYEDEFGEDEDDFAPPVRPRSLGRQSRYAERDHTDARTAEREARPSTRSVEYDARPGGRDRTDSSRLESARTESVRADSAREASRLDAARADRSSVRQLSRPAPAAPMAPAPSSSGYSSLSGYTAPTGYTAPGSASAGSTSSASISFPTQDNLALAPQVQLRERAVVSDEPSRRPQITTLHPTTFNEARTIGEHFREGNPVIMNLTEMDEPDAKRLVDFAAGLAFSVRGSMERVTNRVFLLSPPNIEVSAEDKARIAEGGFFDRA
jgi:cell division inhibitor SepF